MIKVVRNSDCWKLVQFQLLPQYQGRGIGTKLLEELIADAQANRVAITLSVLKVNPARSLYQRLGFRVTADNERSYEMRR